MSETQPLYAVIMAGGSGTRLWPLSRRTHPKQLLDLSGKGRTMFQSAVDRLTPLMPTKQILVITTQELVAQLIEQCPQIPVTNFIVEPEGRGTAPVIGLGAIVAEHFAHGPAIIACLTADHFIEDVDTFRRVITTAARRANDGAIVTLGIKPNYAATGFGYIQQGGKLGENDGFAIYQAEKFKEKPNAVLAESLVADGKHSWNSGMFIWSTKRVSAEFSRQLPETAEKLNAIRATLGTVEYSPTLAEIWPTIPKETIDYGIMEGADNIEVIPVEMGWNDVGSWASLLDVLTGDAAGNVVLSGNHLAVDTRNTLIHSPRLVATIGLDNLVIVDTPDALLVCPANRAQDVKTIVNQLNDNPSTTHYL